MTERKTYATADGKPWPAEGAPFVDPICLEDFAPEAVAARRRQWAKPCGEPHEPRQRF